MKDQNFQRLNLKKLTIAKIDTAALHKIKGGTSLLPTEGRATYMHDDDHAGEPCHQIY